MSCPNETCIDEEIYTCFLLLLLKVTYSYLSINNPNYLGTQVPEIEFCKIQHTPKCINENRDSYNIIGIE